MDLPRHVRALLSQDYPDYRLLFVFESDDDPARPAIQREIAEHPNRELVQLITAGPAPDDTGQKVHNHLAALRHLETAANPAAVWVFADSDAVPGPNWLRKLVGPHSQPDRVGVTTGYRWLVPQLRAQQPQLASMFASVINSGVASFIGHDELTQAWGGSMAIRADFARERGLANYLKGSLSDDYQMTRLARDASKRVYFVHRCLVASPIQFDWPGLFEFGRRQYLITRVHDVTLYLKAVGLIGFYLLANLSAVAMLIYTLAVHFWAMAIFAGLALVIVGVLNQIRAGYRKQAVQNAFGRDLVRYLRHTLWLDRFGTFPVMAVNLALLLSAAFGRTMTWRGHRYRLEGPQQVKRLPAT